MTNTRSKLLTNRFYYTTVGGLPGVVAAKQTSPQLVPLKEMHHIKIVLSINYAYYTTVLTILNDLFSSTLLFLF